MYTAIFFLGLAGSLHCVGMWTLTLGLSTGCTDQHAGGHDLVPCRQVGVA
jgi:hypothetical protein